MAKMDWEKANQLEKLSRPGTGKRQPQATKMRSKYNGICCKCGKRYYKGEVIKSVQDQGWAHGKKCPTTGVM